MSAPVVPPISVSPLSSLDHDEREQVIGAVTTRLPPIDAVTVLAALSGSRAEVAAIPQTLQERALRAILEALPPGLNAVVISKLGIPTKSDEEYLEEVLSEREKADPVFRQRVEAEAQRRGIQRWLAAIRLRHAHESVDEFAAGIGRSAHSSEP